MKLKSLSAAIALLTAPAYALDGQILDIEGKAISGAEIKVVGQSVSTTTDEQGNFQLDLDSTAQLHVTAPGFVHKNLPINADQLSEPQRIVLARSIIEQVDVVGLPLHASNLESAIPITVLAGEELRNKQAATLGDSLAGEVGIHTSFHGNVASTPVIRGLSGSRVLITQNSLDVSDVSRVGPDHSVASEVSTAEQVEVLRGPSTLFFGSGAIGGVVNIVDKRIPTDTETRAEWMLSHSSVNDQDETSFNLNTGTGNIALHADGFWRESNDYDIPASPEIDEDHGERSVASTGEDSEGFTVGASYLHDNGHVGFSYGRLDRDYGVPGHAHGEEEHDDDDDHEEEEEVVTLGMKQNRYQVISELSLDHDFFSDFKARIGHTDYEHTEFENGATGTTFSNETTELKLELLHKPFYGWNGGLVFDYKDTDFSAKGEEAFAPPSESKTFAVAAIEERHFGDVLVQLGARIEHVNIKSNNIEIPEVEFHHHDDDDAGGAHDDDDHDEESFSFDEDYTPFSLSVGAVWEFKPGFNVGVSFSHAERAPSAAELLSYGPHIATGTFEIGALFEAHEEDDEVHFEAVGSKPKMEKSNNIDLTFRKYEGDVGIILNLFYNEVDNYYAQFDTELFAEAGHGDDDDDGHDHAGELPVYVFQSEDVTLTGFEAQTIWQINSNFKTTVFADYVRAKLDDGGDLPRIPPMRFGASVDYVQGRLSSNLSWTRYSDQNNNAEFETDTDGYDWVNAHINYRVPFNSTEVTLFVKAENITDEEARVHSSFLKDQAPRPGRNIQVGIRGSF